MSGATVSAPRIFARVFCGPRELVGAVRFYETLAVTRLDMDIDIPEAGLHVVAVGAFLVLLDAEQHDLAAQTTVTVLNASLDEAVVRQVAAGAEIVQERWTAPVRADRWTSAIAQAMWQLAQQLGYETGPVLEPGCGAGVFIGLAPDPGAVTGVELDPSTAAIAQALHPQASVINRSFAEFGRRRGTRFDLVIGNVPFADLRLHDPAHNRANHSLHNHFLIKSLALTNAPRETRGRAHQPLHAGRQQPGRAPGDGRAGRAAGRGPAAGRRAPTSGRDRRGH